MQPCCSFSLASEDWGDFFGCPSSNPQKQTQMLIRQMCIYNQNIKFQIKIYDFNQFFFDIYIKKT
jgi:hypothetical protein